MDDTTFIKKMKNFMSLLEYCESHNLIKGDVLNVLCFNMSIRKEFESLMLNEYSLMMQQY